MNKIKKIISFCLLFSLFILAACSKTGVEEETTAKEAAQTEETGAKEDGTAEESSTLEEASTQEESTSDQDEDTSTEDTDTSQDAEGTTTPDGEVDSVTLDGMTRDILKNMTLEEKVGQMFVFGLDTLRTDGKTAKTKKITKSIENMMEVYSPGGIILYAKNMKNPEQTKTLIEGLQENTRIPLFVGTEEAGGDNSKIATLAGMEIEEADTIDELLHSVNEQDVFDGASAIAAYMKELGFNVNFAPSANLNEEEIVDSAGETSFGTDAKTVAKMATAFIEGTQDGGVSSVLSTFPGISLSQGDTRKGAVDITKTISELRKTEFVPFTAGIKAGVDFVMVGHASYSSITESQTPASLSKLMVTEILRKELQYDGIIISDSMNKKALTDSYTDAEGAVKAVKAGVDMMLYPGESGKKAYQAVLSAVKSGEIDEAGIDESVSRILKVKIKRGLIPLDTELIDSNQAE